MQIDNQTPFVLQTLPTFGPQGQPVLVVIVKGTFEIRPEEQGCPASEQLPIEFGDQLFDPEKGGSVKFESDLAPYKPRADVAVVGRAYAPARQARESLDVGLRVGQLHRQLRIFGDRHWTCMGRMLPAVMSDPLPFTAMDLIYEKAFGGIDTHGGGFCAQNPVGCGYFNKKTKEGMDGAPLPNIEDPRHPIHAWNDRPYPAGFGFIGKSWAPRSSLLGTYDDKWRNERAPLPPEDFSFAFYNAAHPELQVSGYLRGDETVELTHLTPDGFCRFQLPGIRPVCGIVKSDALLRAADPAPVQGIAADDAPAEFQEALDLHLDTLCILPDEKKFYLVWRGLCGVINPTAMEIRKISLSLARIT